MLNPFESHELYIEKGTYVRRHSVTRSMVERLRQCIKETDRFYRRSSQPIVFFQYFRLQPHDITYESILNQILFTKNYELDPGEFIRFWRYIDWVSDINLEPIRIFNFFMNIPFVAFEFGTYSTTEYLTRDPLWISNFSQHFEPIFLSLQNRFEIQTLMNRYYTKYYPINKKFNDEMMAMIKSFYSPKDKILELDEDTPIYEIYFKDILEHMCYFVKCTSDTKLQVIADDVRYVQVENIIPNIPHKGRFKLIAPHLIIADGYDVPRMIIERRSAPMFTGPGVIKLFFQMMNSYQEGNRITTGYLAQFSEAKRFHKSLNKLLLYMIGLRCPSGMLTDGYTIILIEIATELSKAKFNQLAINQIPLIITHFDCRSTRPTYLQGLLYSIMKVVLNPPRFNPDKTFRLEATLRTKSSIIENNDDDSIQDKKQHSDSQPPLLISFEDQHKVLHHLDYHLSHLVLIKAKFVKDYLLEDIGDEEYVVVKIFDPDLVEIENLNRSETINKVEERYKYETEASKIIMSINANTLYLKQTYGTAIYNYGYGSLIKGKFIISKYLESPDLPITKEIYHFAKEQLKNLHDAGIVHGDINKSHILFDNENNTVYFIDYGTSRINVDDGVDCFSQFIYNKYRDCCDLKHLFKDVIVQG